MANSPKPLPIIVCHGWGLSRTSLSRVAAEFRAYGHAVYEFDLGYYGKPQTPELPDATFVAIGHSFGFQFLLEYVATHGLRLAGAVSLGGFTRLPAVPAEIRALRQALKRNPKATLHQFMERCNIPPNPSEPAAEVALPALLRDLQKLETGDTTAPAIPILAYFGTKDVLIPVDAQQRALPPQKGVQYRVMPGRNHDLGLNENHLFYDEIHGFIARVAQRTTPPSKALIAARFSAAAETYQAAAHIQQLAAGRLLQAIADFVPSVTRVLRIADLGCGTGFLAAKLLRQYPKAEVIACDLAPAMLEETLKTCGNDARLRLCKSDAEHVVFTPEIDINASNFCAQWFDDIPQTMQHHLRQSRYLAWSFLLEGTFSSWLEAHAQLRLEAHIRPFMAQAELEGSLRAMQTLGVLKHYQLSVRTERFHLPDGLTFVRGLRAIGAATSSGDDEPQRAATRAANLRKVLARCKDGLMVEYCIATVLMQSNGGAP